MGTAISYSRTNFAVIGAALVILVWPILPYALSFAAGAMIFIVVEEVIPERWTLRVHPILLDVIVMSAFAFFVAVLFSQHEL